MRLVVLEVRLVRAWVGLVLAAKMWLFRCRWGSFKGRYKAPLKGFGIEIRRHMAVSMN